MNIHQIQSPLTKFLKVIVFKDYETIVYLLKGNWREEIYMTDPDGNNRVDLLTLDKEQEYLNNTIESYVLPEYSCRLNQITPELEKILPKNITVTNQPKALIKNKSSLDIKNNGFNPKNHIPPKYDIYGYLRPFEKRKEDMAILEEKDNTFAVLI